MGRPRVCILSFSPIYRDGRVLRQIEYARREYDIDVIGYGKWTPQWPNVRFQEVKKRAPHQRLKVLQLIVLLLCGWIAPSLWIRAYWWRSDYRDALNIIRQNAYNLIHANDLEALPVAIAATEESGGKVLFDAHEYTPGQAKYAFGKRKVMYSGYISHLLGSLGLRADAFVTVSRGIASLYKKHFNMIAEIIMNAPARAGVNFRPVDPEHIRLIHHGGAARRRQLEKTVEMAGMLEERYTVHFMLIEKEDGYIDELKSLSEKVAPKRVFFLPAVKPHQIVMSLNAFDIGVCLIPPEPVSYKHALPNKFFEAIVAGLAVVIGPSPAMVPIVKEYGLGVISDGFEARDVAIALNKVTAEDINRMKLNALKASQLLNADVEMGKLMEIYRKLLKGDENDLSKELSG
jgi:glycosyltransferase involved in cell wall biosynthesis